MRFLFSLSFIVLAIIAFLTFTKPLYENVGSLKDDIKIHKEALDNFNNLQDLRDNLLESYRTIKQEDIDKLNHLLPSNVNNIELVLEIEKIASVNNLYVKDVKFGGDNNIKANNNVIGEAMIANSLYEEFNIEFNVEGNYQSFVSFLKDLESNLRIVDVESISFDISSNKNNGLFLIYNVKIKTYWLK